MLDLFLTGGQLLHGAAVDDVDVLGAQTQGGSRGVHRHVAAADDGDLAALHDRGDGIVVVGLHQVGAGQELIGGVDALVALAGDVHKVGQTGAGADEHGLIAVLKELVDGQGLADDHVGLDVHAELLEALDLLGNDVLGQTELGNAVDQNAAGGVQGFKDGDLIALLGQIARAGQAGGTGAADGDLVTVGSGLDGGMVDVGVVPVGHEALQAADGNGLKLHAEVALALALGLLRADTAADGGQRGGLGDNLISALEVAFAHLGNEIGNGDVDGAAAHAGTVLAVEAAVGFLQGDFRRVAQRDFLEIVGADLGLLGGHLVLLMMDGHYSFAPFRRLQVSS